MTTTLNETERRVFGALIEKELSQPEYYPMTVNAVTAACNQKSNRNPVMDLSERAVGQTLEDLRKRGLAAMVLPSPGARAHRYKHEAGAAFGWGKRQRAIMVELLLRGPQTVGELRSHCSRMFKFEDTGAVDTALESLNEGDATLVREMPREPGRSANRWTHLLGPEDEVASVTPAAAAGPSTSPVSSDLAAEVAALNEEVAGLHEELTELRRRVETLEARTGG